MSENYMNCGISCFEYCEKSLFDVFKPWKMTLRVLGERGISTSTFEVFLMKIRGQNTQKCPFRSAGAWVGELGAHFPRASAWATIHGDRRPDRGHQFCCLVFWVLEGGFGWSQCDLVMMKPCCFDELKLCNH